MPSHLLRQIEVIEPEDKKDTDRRIGLLVTEELEYTPGVFHVNRIERPKYVDDQTKKIKIAPMPSKPVPKSQFGPQFMAHTIVSKYMDHMPLYRMIQQFKRDHNVAISKSSLGESMHQYLDLLIPVYNKLKAAVLEQEYIQTDETTYKVLSEDKEGSAHLGYIWASYAPVNKLVLFTYQKSRSSESMNNH
ncbi:MAG: transposase [Saprospiraceae bacterium]